MSIISARPGKSPRLHGRRPLLELMEGRLLLSAAPALPAGPHEGAVTQLYQDLLHRLPDAGGLTYWAGRLDAGADTQAVAAAITHGNEFHRGKVDGVYQRLLNRTADEGGRAFFASALDHGQTVPQVETAVAASPEYAAHNGAGGFLDALFNDAAQGAGAGAGGSGTGAAPLGSGPQAVTLKNGSPAVFQAFGPERLVDTRNSVPGQYGGPAFAAGQTRTLNVSPYNLADASIPSSAIGDQAPTSNLPANVKTVSVILFIVGAPQAEYFTAYATGTSPAPIGTATVFADHAGQTIAASALVPVDASGNINIYSSGGGNLIVDVNGYFLDVLDGTDNLPISGSVPGGAGNTDVIVGSNGDTSGSANGVTGVVSSTTPGGFSAGVRGVNNGAGGSGIGVYGSQAGSGWGVYGTAGNSGIGGNFSAGAGGYGVQGAASGAGFGGIFTAGSDGQGVNAQSFGAGSVGGVFSAETGVFASGSVTAVSGTSSNTAANATAIVGTISSTSPGFNSAGVRGINNGTNANGGSIGVWGSQAGSGYGVLGTAGTGGVGVDGFTSGTGSIGGAFTGETGLRVTSNSNGTGITVNNGTGTYGIQVNNTGTGYGVYAAATGSNGWGVEGVGDTRGVFGSAPFGNFGLYASGNIGPWG